MLQSSSWVLSDASVSVQAAHKQGAQLLAFSLCTGKQFSPLIYYSKLAAAILQIQCIFFNATMRLRCRFFPLCCLWFWFFSLNTESAGYGFSFYLNFFSIWK